MGRDQDLLTSLDLRDDDGIVIRNDTGDRIL